MEDGSLLLPPQSEAALEANCEQTRRWLVAVLTLSNVLRSDPLPTNPRLECHQLYVDGGRPSLAKERRRISPVCQTPPPLRGRVQGSRHALLQATPKIDNLSVAAFLEQILALILQRYPGTGVTTGYGITLSLISHGSEVLVETSLATVIVRYADHTDKHHPRSMAAHRRSTGLSGPQVMEGVEEEEEERRPSSANTRGRGGKGGVYSGS